MRKVRPTIKRVNGTWLQVRFTLDKLISIAEGLESPGDEAVVRNCFGRLAEVHESLRQRIESLKLAERSEK